MADTIPLLYTTDGPKDPWPRVLSLPERFLGDPASLARDNIYFFNNGFLEDMLLDYMYISL